MFVFAPPIRIRSQKIFSGESGIARNLYGVKVRGDRQGAKIETREGRGLSIPLPYPPAGYGPFALLSLAANFIFQFSICSAISFFHSSCSFNAADAVAEHEYF